MWGKHPDHADSDSTHYRKGYGATDFRGHYYRTTYRKNVAPFTGKRRNYENNFTRALTSLKARGLIEGCIRYSSEIKLTSAGRQEAERFAKEDGIWFAEDGGIPPPKKSG